MNNDSKTIFRRAKDKENPFVMIDRTIFSDEEVSWKAKGLLGYLLSKPDDWTVRMADLVKRSSDGRYATASAIKELEIAGYLTRIQERDENGHFKQLVIEVHEIPVPENERTRFYERAPKSENPIADNPKADNLTSTDTDYTDTDRTDISADADEPTGESALEEFFGEREKPPERPKHTHWSERKNKPWADWSDGHFHERDGVSVESQEHAAYLVEKYGGLRPVGSYTGWQNGAIGVYLAGHGDWALIEATIREAFAREAKFRPKTLACSKKTVDTNSIVKAVASAWADRHKPVVVIGASNDQPLMRV